MDARSAPERAGSGHPEHEFSDLPIGRRPPGARLPRLPPPVASEALSMPTHDRGRLQDGEGAAPAGPGAA